MTSKITSFLPTILVSTVSLQIFVTKPSFHETKICSPLFIGECDDIVTSRSNYFDQYERQGISVIEFFKCVNENEKLIYIGIFLVCILEVKLTISIQYS